MGKAKKLEDLMDAFFSTRRNDPIRTQHASAADFDEFSDAHMGSGEGAQAYGKGHYFSQGPETHKQYMEQARNYPTNDLGRKPSGENYAISRQENLHLDPDRILDLDEPVELELLDLLERKGKLPPEWDALSPSQRKVVEKFADTQAREKILSDRIRETMDSKAYQEFDYDAMKSLTKDLDERSKLVDVFYADQSAMQNLDLPVEASAYLDHIRGKEPTNPFADFDITKVKESLKAYGGDSPTNKNLVNAIDNMYGINDKLRGQKLLKSIGLQAYKHDDFGNRMGKIGDNDYHNYIVLYPELVETIKKEKGNITLPMLATLASAGAALPPAATKLLKQREKKLANELFGGVLTGAASGAVGGLADILDWVSGRSSPNPELGIEIAGKGADKLEDIQGSILKWADEQGWNDKGAQTLGELIAPGL